MTDFKVTNVPWIGSIPSNWNLCRFKNVAISKKKIAKGKSVDYERLALTLSGVIKRSKSDTDGLQPKEFDSYQIIESGDFVFKMIDLQNISTSRVGLSPFTGLVSPAYLRFKPSNHMDSRFFYYYLMALYHLHIYNHIAGDGVRSALNADDIGNLICPICNLEEQKRISKFLDKQLGLIDELIQNEQKQIEKLKEYRQALISEVVTKGLDKSAPMKDSGVEWIGKIPQDWEIKRFKFIVDSISKGAGITKDQVKKDGDTQCVRYGEIYSKYQYSFENCFSKTNAKLIESKQYCQYGDILFAGTGELVEEIGKNIVHLGNKPVLVGDIIIAKHHLNPIFLSFAVGSQYAQKQKSYGKAKLKVVHISADDIGNIQLALPPANIQDQISDYLLKITADISHVLEIKLKKIDLLNSYKKSLIYEYVTGKKEL